MKFAGEEDGHPSPDIDHPTPMHIRACVTVAICQTAMARNEYVPTWVWDAIRDGIYQACREHDEGRVRK